jgi:hypothetical protein
VRLEDIAALAQVAAVLVATIAILVSLKGIRDQLWMFTYAEYTRRFAEIMDALPFQARRPGGRFDLESLPVAEQECILGVMRRYLNLCSEEYYLFQRGKIDKKTWAIWTNGIRDTVRLPCFLSTWAALRMEYEYVAGFCDFMDRLCSEQCVKHPKTVAGGGEHVDAQPG